MLSSPPPPSPISASPPALPSYCPNSPPDDQDFYKAASVRNPAINLATFVAGTDIPDWAMNEAGLTYDPTKPPSSDDVIKLLSLSPITLADKVTYLSLSLVSHLLFFFSFSLSLSLSLVSLSL